MEGIAERFIVGFTDGGMEGMLIGEEIEEGCTVGVRDEMTEGVFEIEMIGDRTAEGCAVVSSDGDGVTV